MIQAVARRGRSKIVALAPIIFTVLVVLLVELGRRVVGFSEGSTFPSFHAVLSSTASLVRELSFWLAVGQTVIPWLISLSLAFVIGVPLGFLMGVNRWVRSFFTLPVEALRPIPSVALIPLAVVWLGASGSTTKIFLATFASVWPLLYQARYGAGQIDSVLEATARSYQLPFIARVRQVILPSISPFLATGVRLSAAVALILVISAELLVGGSGVGVEINAARQGGDLARMYSLTAVSGLLGWLLAEILKRAEERLLFWHESQRGRDV